MKCPSCGHKFGKKPKPPGSIREVDDYIKLKGLNIDSKLFYDYFEAGDWHDAEGKPVLNWKQKLITWSKRSPQVAPVFNQPIAIKNLHERYYKEAARRGIDTGFNFLKKV